MISLIKRHICDKELSQQPLLVMTEQRASRMSLVPDGKLLSQTYIYIYFYTGFYRGGLWVISFPERTHVPQDSPWTTLLPRWPNNHSAKWASDILKLANDIKIYYGHKYQRSISYLESLANNSFWLEAEPPDMPFHSRRVEPEGMGAPRCVLHQAVLNALAPAVPLRAVFGGDRRE